MPLSSRSASLALGLTGPRVSAAALALAIVLIASGCGEDDGATCVAELCDPAEAATCSGNDVRRCVGGTAYSYTACGAQQRCSADAGAATCVPRQCTTLGVATCRTPSMIERCADDGSEVETFSCGTGERCLDGACVSQSCSESDDDVCTTNGYLRCAAGDWTTGACAPGQVCSLQAGAATCGPAVCSPGVARCQGDVARVCDARGTVETGTTCDGADVCVDGRCQAKVCGVDTPDATSSDTGDASDTSEPEAQMTFRIGGQTFTFDQSAFVDFDDGPRTLTLRATKSTRALHILFENSRANLTGHFSDSEFSTVKVVLCYDDSGPAQTFDRCPDGFTHQSTLYDVTITQNPGPDVPGRVEGTFSGTVNDQNGTPTVIVDGTFSLGFR